MVVVALIAAWTFGRSSLTNLERRLDTLQQQGRQLQPDYRRYARDRYKLEHLVRWEAIQADWLAHAREMARLSPPPDRLVLDDQIARRVGADGERISGELELAADERLGHANEPPADLLNPCGYRSGSRSRKSPARLIQRRKR